MTEPLYPCSFPGCERSLSNGDSIIRISAKGGPFIGRCAEHIGSDEEREKLTKTHDIVAEASSELSPENPILHIDPNGASHVE